MKIKLLKYNQIDFRQYDACIKSAKNQTIYAFSWYLDIVAKKDWEILVLNDYQAVMPLPFSRVKRKFLKRKISQPFFCQQLGIFSLTELDAATFQQFLDKFLAIKPYVYYFNSANTPKLTSLKVRVNYELSLLKSYTELNKNYSKNLKRNINKAKKAPLVITNNITVSDYINLKKSTKNYKLSTAHFKTMATLITAIQAKKLGTLYGVTYKDKLIATAFIIKNEARLIHLFSASSTLGKQYGAIPFLFDFLIQEHANSPFIFDFEGSMVAGIARFYKSFGAVNNPYAMLENT